MFNSNGYSLSDIAAASGNRNNDGGFGGDGWGWIWILLIFCVFGGGWGNGFGGFGGNGANSPGLQGLATRADINEGFALNGIERGIQGIQQGQCDSTYALTNAINSGFSNAELSRCNQQAALMQQLNNMAFQNQQCCCETQGAIKDVRFDMASQSCATQNIIQNTTRDIIDNNNAGFRAILDKMCQQEIASKDATIASQNQRIFGLELAASQANQNAVLTAAMDANKAEVIRRTGNDYPVPAYVVPNPNCCFGNPYGVGYGNCNSGCGC